VTMRAASPNSPALLFQRDEHTEMAAAYQKIHPNGLKNAREEIFALPTVEDNILVGGNRKVSMPYALHCGEDGNISRSLSLREGKAVMDRVALRNARLSTWSYRRALRRAS
jgi:hypothetical protein